MSFACRTVAVIIVNYNTSDLAIGAVESVLGDPVPGLETEVFIVDNASLPSEREELDRALARDWWQRRVHLLAERSNRGFGVANNLIIDRLLARANPPEFILLLNPDAELHRGSLEALVRCLDRNLDAGVVGPRIVGAGGETEVSAYRFPGLASAFEDACALAPVSRWLRRFRVPMPVPNETGPVEWVSGAVVLMRTAVVRHVGGFDPRFFLYFEEVDLMRRARRAGWEVWHFNEASATHVQGAATGLRHDQPQYRLPWSWYESWTHYHRKWHGRAYALGSGLAWLAGDLVNRFAALIRGRRPKAPQALHRDLWCLVFRPLLGLGARRYD